MKCPSSALPVYKNNINAATKFKKYTGWAVGSASCVNPHQHYNFFLLLNRRHNRIPLTDAVVVREADSRSQLVYYCYYFFYAAMMPYTLLRCSQYHSSTSKAAPKAPFGFVGSNLCKKRRKDGKKY